MLTESARFMARQPAISFEPSATGTLRAGAFKDRRVAIGHKGDGGRS